MNVQSSCPIQSLWNQVFRYVKSLKQAHHEAEDITQEVFRLIAERHLVDQITEVASGEAKTRNLLFLIARNVLRSEIRRRNAAKRGSGLSLLPLEENESALAHTQTPSAEAEQKEIRQLWNLQMATLEEEALQEGKHALFLSLREALSPEHDTSVYATTAREHQLNPNTIRVQAHRWRQRLLSRLQSEFDVKAA